MIFMRITIFQKSIILLFLLIFSNSLFAQSTSCQNSFNPLTNCSFETGDFSGWIIKDIATPFMPTNVVVDGTSFGFGLFSTAATDGSLSSINGFDGSGPDTIEYAQDVTIPAGAFTLNFDYRAGWDMIGFCGGCTESRIFSVEVQPTGGGTALEHVDYLMANPQEFIPDTGALSGSLSLSNYQGQNVRIVFIWNIPEDFTGPAQFQLDNVDIRASQLPALAIPTLSTVNLLSLILLISGIAYFSFSRKAH